MEVLAAVAVARDMDPAYAAEPEDGPLDPSGQGAELSEQILGEVRERVVVLAGLEQDQAGELGRHVAGESPVGVRPDERVVRTRALLAVAGQVGREAVQGPPGRAVP